MNIKKNDIVQIFAHPEPSVVGTLLIVDEVKGWGVQGYVRIPYKGDAYFRVDISDVYKVGTVQWSQERLEDEET